MHLRLLLSLLLIAASLSAGLGCGSERRASSRFTGNGGDETNNENSGERPGDNNDNSSCEEGAREACDCGADHVGIRDCVEGAWTSCTECVDPVCPEGETRRCTCGNGGEGEQTCEDGSWRSCRDCVGGDECTGTQTRSCACEGGGEGNQACEEGSWGRCTCSGNNNNNNNNGGGCEVHPDCRRYESKMTSCFPDWGADHYTACDDIFDICDQGDGCNAHYPAHVRCVLRTSCDAIFDDCHPVSCN